MAFDGLFGSSIDDPRTTGLLQLAASLSSNRNVVSGLANGLLGRQQIIAQAADADARGKMRTLELEKAQRDAQREQAIQAAAQQSTISPAQQALMGGGGPTQANAARIPQMQGGFDWKGYTNRLSGIDPMLALQIEAATRKQTPAPIKVGSGEVLLDPLTNKPIYSNPKEDSTPTDFKLYQLSGAQERGIPFDQWDLARRRAGASSVSVNTGQKGLENTLKLRGDFRSEPIYKAQQEMQSAYSQIKQSLGQATPAGDLAGATKLMKLLDPGSVVRESELGMAMAATGMLDRVTNYGNMVLSGERLTPSQRKEFQRLADALYAESASAYNEKRGEYAAIADRNQLNTQDVVGAAAKQPNQGTQGGGALDVAGLLDAANAELARRQRGR